MVGRPCPAYRSGAAGYRLSEGSASGFDRSRGVPFQAMGRLRGLALPTSQGQRASRTAVLSAQSSNRFTVTANIRHLHRISRNTNDFADQTALRSCAASNPLTETQTAACRSGACSVQRQRGSGETTHLSATDCLAAAQSDLDQVAARFRAHCFVRTASGYVAMRLTIRTNLAMRTLMFCAVNPGRIVRRHEVAKACNVLGKPSGAGDPPAGAEEVSAHHPRPCRAGCNWAARPKTITVGEVFRAFEAPLPFAECFAGDRQTTCPLFAACRLKCLLADALAAFYAKLDTVTVADLVRGQRRSGSDPEGRLKGAGSSRHR